MKVRHFKIRLDSENLAEDEKQLNDFLESIDYVKSDTHFVGLKVSFWSVLVHYKENFKPKITPSEISQIVEQGLNADQKELYNVLKQWRLEKSQELKISAVSICHNSVLLNAMIQKVKTRTDLRSIKGFGEWNVENFGDEILAIINAK